jgi:serine/threonine protein kinase
MAVSTSNEKAAASTQQQEQEQDGTTSIDDGDGGSFRLKDLYEIERVLGQGAYGMVYEAVRRSDGLRVALKAMPRDRTGRTDFEREVTALQILNSSSSSTTTSRKDSSPAASEHIVRFYGLHRDDNYYYLAMELIRGGELFDHLVENGPYSEARAAAFVLQFAEALCYVHGAGLAHADLKPENLMLATSLSPTNTDGSSRDVPQLTNSSDSDNNELVSGRRSDTEDRLSLKVVDFGCACTHDASKGDMQLPADEFALGCSVLHQVALGNQFELQRILQNRPELVNFRDYDNRTPLHLAASEGHLDVCRFLVERGARVNRVDRWGGSPLDDAHRHGHAAVVRYLGSLGATFGGGTASSREARTTHFIDAASRGDVEDVEALIRFGSVDLDQGDYDRRTALHLAAGEGRLTIVKLLCEAGANVNVEDRWGNRPLDDARTSTKNSEAMINVLKEYGATSSDDTTSSEAQRSGNAPADSARENDTAGTIAYWPPEMFSKGARPTPAADMWAAGVIVYLLLTGT